jgi:hypothetical protein
MQKAKDRIMVEQFSKVGIIIAAAVNTWLKITCLFSDTGLHAAVLMSVVWIV